MGDAASIAAPRSGHSTRLYEAVKWFPSLNMMVPFRVTTGQVVVGQSSGARSA